MEYLESVLGISVDSVYLVGGSFPNPFWKNMRKSNVSSFSPGIGENKTTISDGLL